MIPAFLIPIIVQVASRGIEMAFDNIGKKPVAKQTKIFEKIEKKDNQITKKMRETYEKP